MSVSPTLSVSLPKTLLRVSQATGFGSMIFFPDFGGSTIYARTLVAELGREISCLTVRFAPDLIEQLPQLSLESISRRFAQDILSANLPKPVHLAGFSFAGFLAQETARQMALLGEQVDRVWIYDLLVYEPLNWRMLLREPIRHGVGLMAYIAKNWRTLLIPHKQPDTLHAYGLVRINLASHPESYRFIMRNLYRAVQMHRPQPSPVATSVLKALENRALKRVTSDLGWLQFSKGPFTVESVPGDHLSMLRAPGNAMVVADIMRRAFNSGSQE